MSSIENIAAFAVYQVLKTSQVSHSAGYLILNEEKANTNKVRATCNQPFLSGDNQIVQTYFCKIEVHVLCYEYVPNFHYGPE